MIFAKNIKFALSTCEASLRTRRILIFLLKGTEAYLCSQKSASLQLHDDWAIQLQLKGQGGRSSNSTILFSSFFQYHEFHLLVYLNDRTIGQWFFQFSIFMKMLLIVNQPLITLRSLCSWPITTCMNEEAKLNATNPSLSNNSDLKDTFGKLTEPGSKAFTLACFHDVVR